MYLNTRSSRARTAAQREELVKLARIQRRGTCMMHTKHESILISVFSAFTINMWAAMNTHHIRARTVTKPILDSCDGIGMSPP